MSLLRFLAVAFTYCLCIFNASAQSLPSRNAMSPEPELSSSHRTILQRVPEQSSFRSLEPDGMCRVQWNSSPGAVDRATLVCPPRKSETVVDTRPAAEAGRWIAPPTTSDTFANDRAQLDGLAPKPGQGLGLTPGPGETFVAPRPQRTTGPLTLEPKVGIAGAVVVPWTVWTSGLNQQQRNLLRDMSGNTAAGGAGLHYFKNLASVGETSRALEGLTGNAAFAEKAAPTVLNVLKSRTGSRGLIAVTVIGSMIYVYEKYFDTTPAQGIDGVRLRAVIGPDGQAHP